MLWNQKNWKKNSNLCHSVPVCSGASVSCVNNKSTSVKQLANKLSRRAMILHCCPIPSPNWLLPKKILEVTIRKRNNELPALHCITCALVHSTPSAPKGHRLLSCRVNRNALPPPWPPSAPATTNTGVGAGLRLARAPLLSMPIF